MEEADKEAAKQSLGGCPRQAAPVGAQRSHSARQSRNWPQGWPGHEDYRSTAFALWSQEVIEIVIASIRARFGNGAIGLGDNGIRFTPTGGAGAPHARMA